MSTLYSVDPEDARLVEDNGAMRCVTYAASLLLAIADAEGAGSDLHSAAMGCVALLESVFPRGSASPNELLNLAAMAIEQSLRTGSVAAESVTMPAGVWSLANIADQLKATAEVVR